MAKSFCILLFGLFALPSLHAQTWEQALQSLNEAYSQQNYQSGLDQSDLALKLAAKEYGSNSMQYAQTLTMKGIFLQFLYRNSEAEPIFSTATHLYKKVFGADDLNYAKSNLNLANTEKALAKYQEAEEHYKTGLDIILKQSGESLEYSSYSLYLGQLYEATLEFEKAEAVFKQVLKNYEQKVGKNSDYYANALFYLAQTYEKSIRYSEAETYYKQVLSTYKSLLAENTYYYASVLNYLAHLYHLSGDYVLSENYYLQTLETARKVIGENHEYYATYLNNLGNLYQNMGREEQALEAYLKVEQIYKQVLGTQHAHYAVALNNLAVVYSQLGNYEAAEMAYEQTLRIYNSIYPATHSYFAITTFNLGEISFKKDNYTQARQRYMEAANLFANSVGKASPEYAKSILHMGLVDIEQGDYLQAKKNLQTALQIQNAYLQKHHPNLALTYYELARVATLTNDNKQAMNYYAEMISNYEHQLRHIFPSLSEPEKLAFYKEIKARFSKFAAFAIRYYPTDPQVAEMLFNNATFTKGLLLATSSKVRNAAMQTQQSEVIDTYYAWKSKKEALAKKFYLDQNELLKRQTEFDSLELAIHTLEKRLSLATQVSFSLPTTDWKTIQKKLKPQQAVVEVLHVQEKGENGTDSVSYACLVLKAHSAPALIQIPEGQLLDKKYRYYKNAIDHYSLDTLSYASFWEPLQDALADIKTIYWLPDGIYNKINPHSLYHPAENQYLADKHLIYTLSDGIALYSENRAHTKPALEQVYLFGYPDYYGVPNNLPKNTDPIPNQSQKDELSRALGSTTILSLPGTKREIEQITSLCSKKNKKAQVFLADKATEDALKHMKSPDILHIATHGFFLKDEDIAEEKNTRSFSGLKPMDLRENPLLRSGLLLANAGNSVQGHTATDKENGILTAYEASNLHLEHTQLVVLSACETGLGEIASGEGVIGLQRAFQLAGARYILMSLWKVDDEATSKLMTAFYNHLFAKQDVHKAFQEAQKELKKQYSSPHYWAAFVIIGI